MKKTQLLIQTIVLALAIQSVAVAQSVSLTEAFKKNFNETVQKVQDTDNADEKRAILNDSFGKMITVIDRIEAVANFSEDKSALLESYKFGIVEMQNELNGVDGFDGVPDADLDEFSNYSQQFMEQADRTITIGLTAVLLIVLILILL